MTEDDLTARVTENSGSELGLVTPPLPISVRVIPRL
jgi:hypothetical protein